MNGRKIIYLDDAIDAICKACSMEEDYHKCDGYPETSTWCDELVALRELPSAQPYTEEQIQTMQDLESAEIEKAYELGRESAQPQWTPCSERPPEIGQSVLLSVGGMYSAEGCLREDGNWAQFRWNAILRKDMVGAWMPLPEPWKGEER